MDPATDLRKDNKKNLRKFVAPEIVFGIGARKLAGSMAAKYGASRILLVTDKGLTNAGWVDEITKSLEDSQVQWTVFSDVTPNPRTSEVMMGAVKYLSSGCDALISLGGGSVTDCAKGIGIVVANGGEVQSYEGADQIPKPMPPLICIPSTGSGSDMSQFAIITDLVERRKLAIVSKSIVPDVSLVDAALLTTMDRYLSACTGIDSLVHAIESFVSKGHSPITDLHALQAIRLISGHLENSIENPNDIDARSSLMLASMQAGLAFSNASLGAVHALSHSLGGVLDLAHGECNSLLLESVLDFNFSESPERYRAIAEAMDIDLRGMTTTDCKAALVKKISKLRMAVGIKRSLGDTGVKTADIRFLAERALQDVCLVTNPRLANRRDLEVIYEESL